jgi:hypothetical protein
MVMIRRNGCPMVVVVTRMESNDLPSKKSGILAIQPNMKDKQM